MKRVLGASVLVFATIAIAILLNNIISSLKLKECSAATKICADSIYDYLVENDSWPRSWEDLDLTPSKIVDLEPHVFVKFDIKLSEVAKLVSKNQFQSVFSAKERTNGIEVPSIERLIKAIEFKSKRRKDRF